MWEILIHKRIPDRAYPEKAVWESISDAMGQIEGYYSDVFSGCMWGNDDLYYFDDEKNMIAEIRQVNIEEVYIQNSFFDMVDIEYFEDGRFGKFSDEELWLFISLFGTTVAKANVHTRSLLQEVIYEQRIRMISALPED